ncbi:MAG: bacterio-opsin activator domain-containing protein [Halodesulfurarchaeum sp.]
MPNSSERARARGNAPSERQYRVLVDATETFREELVLRLAGEAGLRPAEITALRPTDIRERTVNGMQGTLLQVDGDREDGRLVPVPPALADDLRKYGRARDRSAEDVLFPISERRVQMLVREVADRAGLGGESGAVSTRSLRRYFARTAVLDEGIDPRIVKRVGGWGSLDTLGGILETPDLETAVATFLRERQQTRVEEETPTGHEPRFGVVVAAVHDVSATIEEASTQEIIEQRLCDGLVDSQAFDAAWVMGTVAASESPPKTAAGAAEDRLADLVERATSGDQGGILGRAMEEGDVRFLRGSGDGGGRPAGEAPALGAVPLVHGETTFGGLVVSTADPDAFGVRERAALADLGRRVGQAIEAVSHRRLLLTDAVTQLEFRSHDDDAFSVAASTACGCSFAVEGMVPTGEGAMLLYLRVDGAEAGPLVEFAADKPSVGRARLIRGEGEAPVVEVVLTGESLPKVLTDLGGTVTQMQVDEGEATLTAEFPPDTTVRSVLERLERSFPDTEFVAKRDTSPSERWTTTVPQQVSDDLTAKQERVLRAAYLAGYFDWPRGTTAEELAETLDISSPTLHNHLRKGQQTLLDAVFSIERE